MSTPRRQKRNTDGVIPPGRCHACGKVSYSSRKQAKATARRAHPAEKMDTYECSDNPGAWHYGHLPKRVRDGIVPRSVLKARPRPPVSAR